MQKRGHIVDDAPPLLRRKYELMMLGLADSLTTYTVPQVKPENKSTPLYFLAGRLLRVSTVY